MANYDSPIYQIDREGTVLKRFINSLSISGLAWDSWSASGPYLWSWSQDGSNGHLATQIDPKDGHLTGFAFEAALIRANDKETAGVAGGATILPTHGSLRDMPTGLTAMPARLIFVGLQQLSSFTIYTTIISTRHPVGANGSKQFPTEVASHPTAHLTSKSSSTAPHSTKQATTTPN